MKCLIGSAGLLVLLLGVVEAQDRPRSGNDQSGRLELYLRTGRYADARRLIDEMLKTEPRDDLRNVRAVFASGPNMRIRRASASFACEVSDTGVLLPLTVNGRRVQWLVDTGANVTMVSDAEAARLGLVIRDSASRAADLAGGSTGVRTAIAQRIIIGRTQVEDVPFLVMPADQMPWKERPPGKQGILGLPVAIALEAIRWTRTGMCHTGFPATQRSSSPTPANLSYQRLHVTTNVEFEGKTLEFILDTGNQAGTQLWDHFGNDFELLVKGRGRKGNARVTQIGGATDHEIIVIPDMRLNVGGRDVNLKEGKLFSRPVGDDRFHGLLGMDVLSQADDVSIDFRSMRLTLR
jgi:hypothetical protein